MSVTARLEDAEILLANDRREGALLCVLTAVAGTSRARFPRGTRSRRPPRPPKRGNARKSRGAEEMGDGEAFQLLVEEELLRTGLGHIEVVTPSGTRSFGNVLYTLFRCSLAHEAGLGADATFCPDRVAGNVMLRLDRLEPLAFTMSHSTVLMLVDLVGRAPENVQQAASVRERMMSRWIPNYDTRQSDRWNPSPNR